MESTRRRLRKKTEEKSPEPQLENDNITDNPKESTSMFNPDIYSYQESSDDDTHKSPEPIPKRTIKKSQRKNKAAKLPVLNKLFDPELLAQEEYIGEYEQVIDEPLQFESKARKEKSLESFLQKCEYGKKDMADILAHNVLEAEDTHGDTLYVEAPDRVRGFISRRKAINDRQMLREQLKETINNRRTQHIDKTKIFRKSVTELQGNVIKETEAIYKQTTLNFGEREISTNNTSPIHNANEGQEGVEVGGKEDSEVVEKNEGVKAPQVKNQFIEEEAELSGEEVSDSGEDAENDRDLPELIDSEAVKQKALDIKKKHMADMLARDHTQMKKVIDADFVVNNLKRRREDIDFLEGDDNPPMKLAKLDYRKEKRVFEKAVPQHKVFTRFDFSDDDLDDIYYPSFRLARAGGRMMMDEKSLQYLDLITKEETTFSSRSLLKDGDRSMNSSNSNKEAPVFRRNTTLASFLVKKQELI